jgi:ribosome-associated protein
MIYVTPIINLAESELEWHFTSASGPGGQNVNRVSAAVHLRFDVGRSPSFGEQVRQRLTRLAGKRMTIGGELVIKAQRFRSQDRNREDALNRLVVLIRRAADPRRPRYSTRPTAASKERRLVAKVRRSESKRRRRPPGTPDFED